MKIEVEPTLKGDRRLKMKGNLGKERGAAALPRAQHDSEYFHTEDTSSRPSRFDNMSDLWRDTVKSMMYGTIDNGGIDYVANIDCIRYGSRLVADSMAYDFDLGRDLWLNRARWTRLVREYLDAVEVRRFIDNATRIGLSEGKRGVITSMHCNNVARHAKKHRWGNCMLAFTYRGLRTGTPTLTLHSRVTYIAYIGGADLAVAHTLARYIGRRIRVPVDEFRFEWSIDSLQLHAFKSLPMLYSLGYIPDFDDPELRRDYPSFKIIGRWWDTIVKSTENDEPLESIKYGPLRRVTRRYREYINDELLPSVPLKSLDFGPLTRR